MSNDYDYYTTPAAVVQTIIPYLPPLGTVLDPCAGQDAFFNELFHTVDYDQWDSWDIQANFAVSGVSYKDFLTEPPTPGRFDTIISNPPYSLISEWLPRSFAWKPRRIIYLLPLTALESLGRYKAIWHNSPMPLSKIIIFPRRPSFTGNGKTADRGYMWACWGTDFTGPVIDWLDVNNQPAQALLPGEGATI